MNFSNEELYRAAGFSQSKWYRILKQLKKKKKNKQPAFKPTTLGTGFNEPDAKKLSELIGFTLPQKKIT